ncbi:hypothetical protein ACJRO7_031599 [Eucalyptus globulus]|uniref:Uncharacterized protein n=1 Tax=Eucalyptus globulus TaxID=34317 RepID=A0ABD3JKF6_EUCGL
MKTRNGQAQKRKELLRSLIFVGLLAGQQLKQVGGALTEEGNASTRQRSSASWRWASWQQAGQKQFRWGDVNWRALAAWMWLTDCRWNLLVRLLTEGDDAEDVWRCSLG